MATEIPEPGRRRSRERPGADRLDARATCSPRRSTRPDPAGPAGPGHGRAAAVPLGDHQRHWTAANRDAVPGRRRLLGRSSRNRFHQYLFGLYPVDQYWRLITRRHPAARRAASRCSCRRCRARRSTALGFAIVYPIIAGSAVQGRRGRCSPWSTRRPVGRPVPHPADLASSASSPRSRSASCWRWAGARRCRWSRRCASSFIELVRGVPLVTVLFMASVMLPLFFPPGWTIDKLHAGADRRVAVLAAPTWPR